MHSLQPEWFCFDFNRSFEHVSRTPIHISGQREKDRGLWCDTPDFCKYSRLGSEGEKRRSALFTVFGFPSLSPDLLFFLTLPRSFFLLTFFGDRTIRAVLSWDEDLGKHFWWLLFLVRPTFFFYFCLFCIWKFIARSDSNVFCVILWAWDRLYITWCHDDAWAVPTLRTLWSCFSIKHRGAGLGK